MYTIVIDPGHGGADPGAVFLNRREAALNLKTSLMTRDILANYECRVIMTRETDVTLPFAKRTDLALREKADIYLCDHKNAAGGDGFECYYWHTDERSKAFAEELNKQVLAIGQNSRGIKPSKAAQGYHNFGACRINSANGIVAVLTEGFFVDNEADFVDFDTDAELQKLANAYAMAIVNYAGLKLKQQPVPEPQPEPSLYSVVVALSGHVNAADAKTGANPKKDVAPGMYYVYREYDGMLNVSPVPGKAGSWINPAKNVKPAAKKIEKGSAVKIKEGAKTYDGVKLSPFVYKRTHRVKEITKGDRAVLTFLGVVVAAVNTKDIYLA